MSVVSFGEIAQLIAKVEKEDDRTAFEEIYRRFNNQLFLRVYPQVAHVQDAEEIVLDSFMNAYRAIRNGRYQEQGKFWYWLCKISENEVKGRSKKTIAAGRDVDTVSIEETIDSSGEKGPTLGDQIPSQEPEPSIDAEVRERNERLIQALKGLPKRYSDVMELYIKGSKPKEISCLLEISVDAVRKRIKRGVIYLKRRLSKDPYFKEYYTKR